MPSLPLMRRGLLSRSRLLLIMVKDEARNAESFVTMARHASLAEATKWDVIGLVLNNYMDTAYVEPGP